MLHRSYQIGISEPQISRVPRRPRHRDARATGRRRKKGRDHLEIPHRYQIGVSGWSQVRFQTFGCFGSGERLLPRV